MQEGTSVIHNGDLYVY